MNRGDNSSDNNIWQENHLDANSQDPLNSSSSTVDSVLVYRPFSMIKLLSLSRQFYNYLDETAKQFNHTANRIKNSEPARQINQKEDIKVLINLKIKNMHIRSQYEQKLEQTLVNDDIEFKQMALKAVKMKILVHQFDQNQKIGQIFHFFNVKKRDDLLNRQKQYLQKYKQKMEFSNKIQYYDLEKSYSFSSPSKSQQLEQEYLNKSTVLRD